jgi:hypothetical protein
METYMFERKMDNCKPCGGAIPLCMIDEFKLPEKIVDRKVIIRDLAVNDSTQGRSGCDKHWLSYDWAFCSLPVACIVCLARCCMFACYIFMFTSADKLLET